MLRRPDSVELRNNEGLIGPDNPLPVIKGLNIPIYDYIALTYVSAGNGVGEIETAIYKTGGSGGSTVATLTLTYDANNNLSSVVVS